MGLLSMQRVGDRITRRPKVYRPHLKPALEDLENRTVLSHGGAGSLVSPDVLSGALSRLVPTNVVVDSIDLEEDAVVALVDGALTITDTDGVIGTLTGTISGQTFTADLANLTLAPPGPDAAGDVCSVLSLELGPINLAIPLLGVNLDTSAICLEVTATEGQGLLGSLLCDIVDGGLDLGDFLGGVTDVGLLDIVEGDTFTSLVSSALSNGMENGQPGGGDESICTGDCELLHLVLGPIDLDVPLLGVSVNLDNCEGGPVEVCLSANEGEGLLGSLLCNIVDGGLLDDLNFGQLNRLVGEVENFLDDGVLDASELLKLAKTRDQILRKLG
jgi:hypothetical protein